MQIKTTVKYYFTHPLLSFSRQVMSNSLWPHGLQHTRLLCPSPSWDGHWIGDAIQPSHPLLPSLPSAISLCQHQGLFQWVSCSCQMTKILEFQLQYLLPVSIQGWFPLRSTGLISLLSKGLSSVFSSTTVRKHLRCSAFFMTQLSHPYVTPGKTIALTIRTFVGKVMPLLFINTLSGSVIAFLPRSNRLLTSCLQSPSAVILELKKRKFVAASTFSPSICHEVMGPDAMILVFWMLSFKSAFSFSSCKFIKRLFHFSSLSATRAVSSASLRLLKFLPAILIPTRDSSSTAFSMMYFSQKLNKQGNNI